MHLLHGGNAERCIVQMQQKVQIECKKRRAPTPNTTAQERARDREKKKMAYANTSRVAGFQTAGFAGFRAAIVQRWNQYKVYRETVNELDALSNRELADLGISRSMIKGIALEAAGRI